MDTWAMETYGRISTAMERDMKSLSARAAARDRDRGLLPRHRFRTWLARVSAAIAKCRALAWLGACAFPVTTHEGGKLPGGHARHHADAESAPADTPLSPPEAEVVDPEARPASASSSGTDDDPHIRGRRMFRKINAARLVQAQRKVRKEAAQARRRSERLGKRIREQIQAHRPDGGEVHAQGQCGGCCTAAPQSGGPPHQPVASCDEGHAAAAVPQPSVPLPASSESERTAGLCPPDHADGGVAARSRGGVSRLVQIFC